MMRQALFVPRHETPLVAFPPKVNKLYVGFSK